MPCTQQWEDDNDVATGSSSTFTERASPASHGATSVVELTWDDGSISTFHHLWLRDNCPCSSCRHPSVPERLIDTQSIAEDVAPASIDVSPDGDLLVEWAGDGHRSAFDSEWLADHSYDDGPRGGPTIASCGPAGRR